MKDRLGNWHCEKCGRIIATWVEALRSAPIGSYCDFCRRQAEPRATRTVTTDVPGLLTGVVAR